MLSTQEKLTALMGMSLRNRTYINALTVSPEVVGLAGHKQLNAIRRESEDKTLSQFYKILKADPLGEPWTPNAPDAKPIQNYWCQVEGEELAVSIGKQVGNSITPGESIYGDLMKATSQKGTNYWKFKSAKIPEGVTRPASTPAQHQAQQATGHVDMSATMPAWFQPWANMIHDTYKMTKDLHGGLVKGAAVKEEPETKEVDDDTLAVIKEIFPTEPETPEGV